MQVIVCKGFAEIHFVSLATLQAHFMHAEVVVRSMSNY